MPGAKRSGTASGQILLEVCVDSQAGLEAAIAGGADRIELCAALEIGGLSPSAGFMAAAACATIPVNALIRPRAGDFVFSSREVAAMIADIAAARQAGLAGVVIGASRPGGQLHRDILAELVEAAQGLDLTLHRAFDLVPDFDEALDLAVDLGFSRVLTSGGETRAPLGLERLRALMIRADGRISIMPGSGISAANVPEFLALPGITELHASCSSAIGSLDPKIVELGFASADSSVTDATKVAALKAALRR